MRISDWSSDVCSADLLLVAERIIDHEISWGSIYAADRPSPDDCHSSGETQSRVPKLDDIPPGGAAVVEQGGETLAVRRDADGTLHALSASCTHKGCTVTWNAAEETRSEEHTSELQSLMRISYAVFCLKKKKNLTTD